MKVEARSIARPHSSEHDVLPFPSSLYKRRIPISVCHDAPPTGGHSKHSCPFWHLPRPLSPSRPRSTSGTSILCVANSLIVLVTPRHTGGKQLNVIHGDAIWICTLCGGYILGSPPASDSPLVYLTVYVRGIARAPCPSPGEGEESRIQTIKRISHT